MPRDFCTAGPIRPEENYHIPPLERQGLETLRQRIDAGKYFILHAPRQTGKTSALWTLAGILRAEGYRAVYANIEPAQTARSDVQRGTRTILSCLAGDAAVQGDAFMAGRWLQALEQAGADGAIKAVLAAWAADAQGKAVLFLDEVDSLVGDTLVALLRQLRSGYVNRPDNYPLSVILCGVRDVKDYRIHTSSGEIITGGSCFNIKDESLRMGDFTREQVLDLYGQHTHATGQAFAQEALDLAFALTQGQPWLVNALGRQAAFEPEGVLDRARAIGADDLLAAKERLIQSRATHLDQLADKLGEDRVRRVIEPILLGEEMRGGIPPDDLTYCIDLGLVRRTSEGYQIANPIYREVIPRELTYATQDGMLSRFKPTWIRPDGGLDVPRLLAEFQDFYLQDGEIWADRFAYREAGVQLLVQAFLQRVVNGQGYVQREFPLGSRRADLLLLWPLPDGGKQKAVVELKVLRWDRGPADAERSEREGIVQAADYAERCQAGECHLLLCSRGAPPAGFQRRFRRGALHAGRMVTVWGM